MDKKTKKKIDKLNQHLQQLRQQLSGAKRQDDEPGEIDRLEREIETAKAKIVQLKDEG